MNIGRIIQELRNEKKINQIDFAKLCGISQTSLSQIETGTKRPSSKNFKKICKHLGVPESIVYLLATEEGDVPKKNKVLYRKLFPSAKNLMLKILEVQ